MKLQIKLSQPPIYNELSIERETYCNHLKSKDLITLTEYDHSRRLLRFVWV